MRVRLNLRDGALKLEEIIKKLECKEQRLALS